MRRFKLQVQTSVDGYMGNDDGGLDYMAMPWDDELLAYVDELTTPAVDTIVLGRKLAEGFIPAWESGPPGEDQASIDWMNGTPKVVISNTLTESPWKNATIANGDLVTAMTELKQQPGGEIITYGGATLVQDLIANGLLDELNLFVNPTAIGSGLKVFGGRTSLRLVHAQGFACGITALRYEA